MKKKIEAMKIRQWVKALVIINLISILVGTLFSFNFSFIGKLSIKKVLQSFDNASNPLDFIANILLFISFGFFCSWLLNLKGFKGIKLAAMAVGVSTIVSTVVEVLQVFLPLRVSTKADIFANSLGGFFGYLVFLLFYWCLSISLTKLKKIFSPKCLGLCLTAYLTIIFCLAKSLSNSVSLENWNLNFPLVLGNEATGDKPWHGSIDRLAIYDQAFDLKSLEQFLTTGNTTPNSERFLLGHYLMFGSGNYRDRTGQLPVLTWKGQLPFYRSEDSDKSVALLTRHQWLETPNAPRLMIERIRRSSQFTLCTIIASDERQQTGPARIISLSKDSYHRNFTLAQEESNLIFRLRTPLMGNNGVKFKLSIPNLFIDTNYHRLAISYDRSTIKVYFDDLSEFYSWKLMPEAALFKHFFSDNFSYEGMSRYKLIFYLIIFVPLGFLLGLFSLSLNTKLIYDRLWLTLAIVLIAGMLQILLTNANQINFSTSSSLLLSISITIVSVLVVKAIAFLTISPQINPVLK